MSWPVITGSIQAQSRSDVRCAEDHLRAPIILHFTWSDISRKVPEERLESWIHIARIWGSHPYSLHTRPTSYAFTYDYSAASRDANAAGSLCHKMCSIATTAVEPSVVWPSVTTQVSKKSVHYQIQAFGITNQMGRSIDQLGTRANLAINDRNSISPLCNSSLPGSGRASSQ